MAANNPPTRREAVYRLALETLLSARTIGDVIDGKGVRASTRRSVELAAGRLGIDLAAYSKQAKEPSGGSA